MTIIRNQLANMLTLSNLIFGVIAIHFVIEGEFFLGVIFVMLGGIADMFDGMVARRLNISSKIGKYLDSNSDLVTFGIAPAFLIYKSVLFQYEVVGPIIVLIYITCSSIRLAKFNSVKYMDYFVGVPTTLAGPILALSVLIREYLPPMLIAVFMLLMAFLMVSEIKVKKVWN